MSMVAKGSLDLLSSLLDEHLDSSPFAVPSFELARFEAKISEKLVSVAAFGDVNLGTNSPPSALASSVGLLCFRDDVEQPITSYLFFCGTLSSIRTRARYVWK